MADDNKSKSQRYRDAAVRLVDGIDENALDDAGRLQLAKVYLLLALEEQLAEVDLDGQTQGFRGAVDELAGPLRGFVHAANTLSDSLDRHGAAVSD